MVIDDRTAVKVKITLSGEEKELCEGKITVDEYDNVINKKEDQ